MVILNFEYDINKNLLNEKKHGIDFEQAKELFYDDNSIMYPSKYTDETRYFVVGRVLNNIFTSIITYRESNIRIISVRRSSKKEIDLYLRLKDEKN